MTTQSAGILITPQGAIRLLKLDVTTGRACTPPVDGQDNSTGKVFFRELLQGCNETALPPRMPLTGVAEPQEMFA